MRRLTWIAPLVGTVMIWFGTSMAWSQTSPPQPGRHSLIAAGSGVNLGITRLLAKAFMENHPQITIDVPGSIGSKGAITAVPDGAIAIGLISRPLQDNEQSPGLVVRPYARVPMVVGAHPTVADDEVSFQDLVDIYRGTKTRWQDGNEIIVQVREPFDSGFQVLEKQIPGFKEACEESRKANRWSVFFTDQDANRALSSTPYAIGVTDLGMIVTERLDIKVLKLNGVVPGPDSLLRGQYPLSRDLLFLYRENTLSDEARAFMDFVGSEEGGKILRANGYLPVK